ncbi:MAG: glucose-6-phosphate dehydrogenase [Crocinitomicaceae bacterium]
MSIKRPKIIKPFNAVIFGGDGDLAFRKIYPALFHRFVAKQLEMDHDIFAITRSQNSDEQFFANLEKFIVESVDYDLDIKLVSVFMKKIKLLYIPEHTNKAYAELKQHLEQNPERQCVYYLSTPSSAFGDISDCLKRCELLNERSKVVLEKPLGNSLASSRAIHEKIAKSFSENQIYRIDHYLGKETVQNLMVLRFANRLFESSWNSDHIDNIQITVAENLGVEKRGEYYDQSGALLDMVQNHLLQLLCLIAMEPPSELEADYVRNEKLKVLHALRLFDENSVQTDTTRGQYTRGNIDGQKVNSYLEDIEKYESQTETFVAIKAYIDNWRWKDTPFYLRTGKRMIKRYSEIIINFKSVKHNVFDSNEEIPGNKLIMRLQPEERIELVQMTKLPGPGGYRYKPISLKLDYIDSFTERFPEAYERLMIDILRGQQTLFMRQDELDAAWIWIESIVNGWKKSKQQKILYEAGSWGPGDGVMMENHQWSKSIRINEDEAL